MTTTTVTDGAIVPGMTLLDARPRGSVVVGDVIAHGEPGLSTSPVEDFVDHLRPSPIPPEIVRAITIYAIDPESLDHQPRDGRYVWLEIECEARTHEGEHIAVFDRVVTYRISELDKIEDGEFVVDDD